MDESPSEGANIFPLSMGENLEKQPKPRLQILQG